MVGRFTGQSIDRVEDDRFLRGRGRYAASIAKGGMRHLAFVRSPHAHARIRGIDTSAALALAGVDALLTAADLALVMTGPMQIIGPPALKVPLFHPLAVDKVRLVGDPVAIVVAIAATTFLVSTFETARDNVPDPIAP